MKLNTEKVNSCIRMVLNDDCEARVDSAPGFMKMVVFYRHGQPVWAHKDYVVAEEARLPEKTKKNRKKGLTKG